MQVRAFESYPLKEETIAITVIGFTTRPADCRMKSASEIIYMSVRVTMSKKMHTNANIVEMIHFSVSQR